MSSNRDRTVPRRTLRVATGAGLGLLGAAVVFGWPFVDVLAEPHFDAGFLPLGIWLAAAGAVFAVTGFTARWRTWPWRRPRPRPLRWLTGITAAVVVPFSLMFGSLLIMAPVSTVGELEFRNTLAIPELLEPTEDEDGRLVFDLTAREGQRSFLPGTVTDTLGINGDYLGPTLRADRGDDVRVNVTNALDEPTTLHWHGMHLPASADGGPHQVVAPGDTWSPRWTVDQPAGTLWYHPHLHGTTGEHVYRGLAGLFLIDDPDAGALGLPADYGNDDIPLIVQDRQFDGDGAFDWQPISLSSMGVLGDEIVVNGTHDPYLTVADRLVRLRILNGSNNRIFDFGFDDDRAFWQIASDGGLLAEPHETRRVLLSPGERAEIVVAFEPGDDTILRSFPPHTGAFPGPPIGERRVGGADTFDILNIRADDELNDSPPLPNRLAAIEPVSTTGAEPDRIFELSDSMINDRAMDMSRIDEVVAAGTSEVWELTNTDTDPHGFHIHDKQFQVLSVDDTAPGPERAGWKDTVLVRPGETIRIGIQFGGYADPETPYMYHCHVLAHEDEGMMGQFVVVEPGTEGDVARTLAGAGDGQHHGHHE